MNKFKRERIREKDGNFKSLVMEDMRKYTWTNNKNLRTAHLYKSILRQYLCHIGYFTDVSDNSKVPNYFESGRDIEADIRNFWEHVKTLSEASRNTYMTAIRQFIRNRGMLYSSGIKQMDYPKEFWDSLPKGNTRGPVVMSDILDKGLKGNPRFKLVVQNVGTYPPIMGKAFLLLLLSSGLRPGEATQLVDDDIDFENRVINVRAEIAKKRYARKTCFTEETKTALLAWLPRRKDYVNSSKNRGGTMISENTGVPYKRAPEEVEVNGKMKKLLFPFSPKNAGIIWYHALKNATPEEIRGNEKHKDNLLRKCPVTGRYVYRLYSLRSSFFSKCIGAGVHSDLLAFMMGHKKSGNPMTEKYYRDYGLMIDEYKKVEPYLLVFETPMNILDLEKRLSLKDDQMDFMSSEIKKLQDKLGELILKVPGIKTE